MSLAEQNLFDVAIGQLSKNTADYVAQPLPCSEYKPKNGAEWPIGMTAVFWSKNEGQIIVIGSPFARADIASIYGVPWGKLYHHSEAVRAETAALVDNPEAVKLTLIESFAHNLLPDSEDAALYVCGTLTQVNTSNINDKYRRLRTSFNYHRALLSAGAAVKAYMHDTRDRGVFHACTAGLDAMYIDLSSDNDRAQYDFASMAAASLILGGRRTLAEIGEV